jgi:hypothetical protein
MPEDQRADQNDQPQYVWTEIYRTTLLELDQKKLKELLPQAEQLLLRRQAELIGSRGHRPEIQALEDALRNLRVLKRELTK